MLKNQMKQAQFNQVNSHGPSSCSSQKTPKNNHRSNSNTNIDKINRTNSSNLTNKSCTSLYLDRKHQTTSQKIERMRNEAYDKLMSEVKAKPTISPNSKKIIHQLFKRNNHHNNPKKIVISHSVCNDHPTQTNIHNDESSLSYSILAKKPINISSCTSYTNMTQVEQYQSIIKSRNIKIKEKAEEKRKKAHSQNSNPLMSIAKKKNCVIPTEVIQCQRDKLFDQEYVPYNEQAVCDVRKKLQQYYDCKGAIKSIPFNQQSGSKGGKNIEQGVTALKQIDKESPIVIVRNNNMIPIPIQKKNMMVMEERKGNDCINEPRKEIQFLSQPQIIQQGNRPLIIKDNNHNQNRRVKDVQMLINYTKTLGMSSNTLGNEKKNDVLGMIREKDTPVQLKPLKTTNTDSNRNNQNETLLKISKETNVTTMSNDKQLNPSAKLFLEERMKMIRNNFQLQEPPQC